jgi:hypothetical protein
MPITLELDWDYCPDGVELYDRENGGFASILGTSRSRVWVRPRSDRRARHHFVFDNPNRSLVLEFDAAKTEAQIVKFCSQYGLLGFWLGSDGLVEMALEEIELAQAYLGNALATQHFPELESFRVAQFNESPTQHPSLRLMLVPCAGDKPRLTFQCRSLFDYMRAEVGMILGGAGRLMTCQHCGKFFVVGTGRNNDGFRANKTHCSPACVTAASRGRKKKNEEKRQRVET